MRGCLLAVAVLPVQDLAAPPSRERFFRICLRHGLTLDYLTCPGPGLDQGHTVERWGVYDWERRAVVSVGSEDRIVLLDAFDYLFKGAALTSVDLPVELRRHLNPAYDPHQVRPPGRRKQVRKRHARYKLTETQVSEIKLATSQPGWRLAAVARRFNVTAAAIHSIRTGRSWAHILGPPSVPPIGGREAGVQMYHQDYRGVTH